MAQIGTMTQYELKVLEVLSAGHRPVSHVCAACAWFPCLPEHHQFRGRIDLFFAEAWRYLRPPCSNMAGFPVNFRSRVEGG
jgi:hypothetical protein